ncbi:RDD family protein [Kribbella caucasensis]|nr:RDD family protein [Kribbella sp. VKM Ac-2527]
MSTPPNDPRDRPPIPGQVAPPGQPGQYGPPGQPGQYSGPPGQPGGGWSGGQPSFSPAQPGYNPYGGGGGPGFSYAPPGQLASWGSRVMASIVDSLIAVLPIGIGAFAAVGISGSLERMSDGGRAALAVAYIATFSIAILNRLVLQGRTGQSIGKKMAGLKIVKADTGDRIGFGRNFLRELMSLLFNYICFLNFLWPLWDEKHQTWHDKVVSDIVIKL